MKPDFNETYRGGKSCGEVTSDRSEKINIRGVKPEIVERAVAKLSKPRENSTPSKPRLRHL